MRTRLIALAFGLLAVLIFASPASAGWQWCAKDPVVRLNGTQTQIVVAIPVELQTAVTGPIQVDIAVPAGVSRELISTDAGYNGYGESVRFTTDSSLPSAGGTFVIRVRASVPLDARANGGQPAAMMVAITPENGASRSTVGTTAGVVALAPIASSNP